MKKNPVLIEVGLNLDIDTKRLFQTVERGDQSFLLDVSRVDNIDIASLSLLSQAQAKLQKHGHTIALIQPSAYLRTWLYVTKLHQILPSFPNLSLGNQYLQKLQKHA